MRSAFKSVFLLAEFIRAFKKKNPISDHFVLFMSISVLVCYLVLWVGLKSCDLAAANIVVTLRTLVYLIHSTFIHVY